MRRRGLPRLIDRAMSGEEVIITRHGTPVAELRPATQGVGIEGGSSARAAHERLFAALVTVPGAPTSVQLLDLIYDDPRG